MTITIRLRMAFIGLMAAYACLCACWSHGQASDKPKLALSEPQKRLAPKIDMSRLVFPYYEWVSKDTALAWVSKPDGSVVAIPLTGERHEEMRIGGLSDIKQLGSAYPNGLLPYPNGMKMSPDGSKVLYITGLSAGPAERWCVGTLDGTRYTTGDLVAIQAPDLVWKRNSKEWVSLVRDPIGLTAVHYYIDGVTPPIKIPIQDFAPWPHSVRSNEPEILGLRRDGIAIVTYYVDYPQTTAVDIYMVNIDKGRVLPGKHHIPLPTGAKIKEMDLSHSGDRIAWLFDTEVIHKGKSFNDDVFNVWLSNADGSNLKRLSGFPPHVLESYLLGHPETEVAVRFPIRWTMDDTAVSFLQGDELQLVKVK